VSARPETAGDARTTCGEAVRLASELGSRPEAVEEHLNRMPGAYPESVSPRAIVRHTLMIEAALAPHELRTRVTPGESSAAADELVDELDVVTMDAPGWFAKVAGVIALQGGSIVAADAFTRDDGILVDTFVVRRPEGTASSWWARVEGDLVDAAAGRLAVRARVARRAREDAPRADRAADVRTRLSYPIGPEDPWTVMEIRTVDRLGVLYAIASAIAELDVDIVDARIQTVGNVVIDVFRLRDRRGRALDEDQQRELELSVISALELLGR